MNKRPFSLLFFIFAAVILVLSVRGVAGNPTAYDINTSKWKDEGPIELSPDRGRFALLYSLVEEGSFHFSIPIARFATPDLGYSHGKYVSLFAPGLSFLVAPGYLLGKTYGLSQVGTFAVVALFALFNAILLRSIAVRLGAHWVAATLASLVFLFATPAFAYAVSLYQHHISTFLILLSIYILLRWDTLLSLAVVWFLIAASLPVDYPNVFLMFPIGLYALGRIVMVSSTSGRIHVSIRLARLLTIVTAALPLAFFLWFNFQSYSDPFQLSGTVAGVKAIDAQGKPAAPEEVGTQNVEVLINPEQQNKSAVQFFKTRHLLNGFQIHLVSPDRGIIVYAPVILFGVAGIFLLYKSGNQPILALLLGILGANILLYSLWGDPWGGWAFGSRYLIPGYAIMSLFIALALTRWRKSNLILLVFFLVASYSIAINALGAITSSRNPPQVEVLSLEALSGVEQKYTYGRNIDYLNDNRSKSFVFQTYAAKYMNAWQYYRAITISLLIVTAILLGYFRVFVKEKKL